MEDHAYPLEPSRDQMRVMVDKVAERVIDHIASLARQPASYAEHEAGTHARTAALAESLPERGTDLDGLLDLLFREAVPLSYNTAAPGYLAYIPGGGVFPSAVADFIANAVNRYVGVCSERYRTWRSSRSLSSPSPPSVGLPQATPKTD